MIVVVGGRARKAGKTRAVCDIIAATPDAGWVAVKITTHEHPAMEGGDTARYMAAGAAAAHLLNGPAPFKLPQGKNLIVESNTVMEQIEPDLFVFIEDRGRAGSKPSAERWRPRAHFIVDGVVTAEVIERVRALLSGCD